MLAYCLVLVMTHPVANYRFNVGVMADSFVCTQKEVFKSTEKVVDAALAPAKGNTSYTCGRKRKNEKNDACNP